MTVIPKDLDYSQAEHICLEGDTAVGHIDPAPRSVDYRLELKRPSHGTEQVITLYDDGSVSIERGGRKTKAGKYLLHTRFLDAKPEVTRHIARRVLITTLVTACLSLCLLALPISLGGLNAWRLPAGILLATTSLFALLLAGYRSGETLRFASLHGRVAVLTISGGIRCHHRCAQLVERLTQASKDARQNATRSDSLRDEMRDHHRLKVEGIISDADYETAKLRILSAHD